MVDGAGPNCALQLSSPLQLLRSRSAKIVSYKLAPRRLASLVAEVGPAEVGPARSAPDEVGPAGGRPR